MLLPLALGCASPDQGPTPTTLVLVTFDTLRGDYVGEPTPFLQELTAEGLELRDLDTQAWTYPGIGALITGLHPVEWGVESWSFDPDAGELPYWLGSDVTTLAEALSAEGWATAYWSSNPIAADKSGFYRGYDKYTEYDPGETVGIGREAREWLERHREQPRFLHLHVNDPHSPYSLTAESCAGEVDAVNDGTCRWDFVETNEDSLYANDSVRDGSFSPESEDYEACVTLIETAYRCEVERQDEDLRAAWDALSSSGEIDDALTVFATDHGEALLDPFTNHSFDLRMPVLDGWGLVRWPGHVEPGVNELPVSQEDIVPTILDLLALDVGMTTSGFPVAEVPEDRIRTAFFGGPLPGAYYWDHVRSAYDADRHYIVDTTGACWLYDRVNDPAELTNLCPGEEPPANLVEAIAALDAATVGYSEQPPPPE